MNSITKPTKRAKLTKKQAVFFVSFGRFVGFVIELDRTACTNRANLPEIIVAQQPGLKPLDL